MKKYGRTYHLPWSPGVTSDDKVLKHITRILCGDDSVVTEKMDGENTTIYSGGTHARSVDGRHHPSRDWMKAYAAGISPMLDENERIIGEYLYARHSIAYNDLESYFYGFAWIVDNVFQSWDDTVQRFESLGIIHVPVLYRGPLSESKLHELEQTLDLDRQEGYVVRCASAFTEEELAECVGKYVRENHVQSDTHWMHAEIEKNQLK